MSFGLQILNCGEPIEIRGQHTFERLDVRDAVNGIVALLEMPENRWREVYNLGRGIEELADEVIAQVSRINEVKLSPLIINIEDKSLHFGMDSRDFYQDTGWQPRYSLGEMIESLIRYYNKYGLE